MDMIRDDRHARRYSRRVPHDLARRCAFGGFQTTTPSSVQEVCVGMTHYSIRISEFGAHMTPSMAFLRPQLQCEFGVVCRRW